jgi:hypothetical protein
MPAVRSSPAVEHQSRKVPSHHGSHRVLYRRVHSSSPTYRNPASPTASQHRRPPGKPGMSGTNPTAKPTATPAASPTARSLRTTCRGSVTPASPGAVSPPYEPVRTPNENPATTPDTSPEMNKNPSPSCCLFGSHSASSAANPAANPPANPLLNHRANLRRPVAVPNWAKSARMGSGHSTAHVLQATSKVAAATKPARSRSGADPANQKAAPEFRSRRRASRR